MYTIVKFNQKLFNSFLNNKLTLLVNNLTYKQGISYTIFIKKKRNFIIYS